MTSTPPADTRVLLLRLAGPLQSWGDRSAFNRRETRPEPTKSGIVGLLAAAAGRPRGAALDDLAGLDLGIRTDQPGSILRDYHTVSDYRGRPLPAAAVNAKGLQKPTSPAKHTHVTQRFYLQDAVFVAALEGPDELVTALEHALRRPVFPLALGRRSCTPTQPLVLGLRARGLLEALQEEPWQVHKRVRERWGRRHNNADRIDLPVTLDDLDGNETRDDVPLSFTVRARAFTTRRVRHTYLSVPTDLTPDPDQPHSADSGHDPFALLGW
ncbi:type I-E CRISPR-associated protein Cas5/CasD [Streptomyces sp. UNOC14_S4]|uniref:type I-E CRISPR-associated protein Cas5/CasD n=1 Tax=Streptomyces sp. UNOC14_S4 TaxID=2872340 RepID=UPI001E283A49|nr:type I-E CRISPR-associated protein Cas5/CasD [Streptomyces sp. UNOC14_S4]MCC3769500.1 type I-E CRISPR-associated protein Cas5/CasD [Streptomyces sp. UNOC14_S4]